MLGKICDSGVLAIYCLLIFFVSAQSHMPVIKLFSFQDKAIHAAAFAVMSLLAWRCFGHFVREKRFLMLFSAGFSGLYGLSDEVHQYFVPGRIADPLDWIADVFGAVLAVLILAYTSAQVSPDCSPGQIASVDQGP